MKSTNDDKDDDDNRVDDGILLDSEYIFGFNISWEDFWTKQMN